MNATGGSLVLVCIALGCGTANNTRSVQRHAEAAFAAISAGDWHAAREHWAQAVVNARLGRLPAQDQAVLTYEYGRSLGATCFFDEAQEYLSEAKRLDNATGGPVHMATLELARLNQARSRPDAALSYYEELHPLYVQIHARRRDPQGVAEVLRDHAKALDDLGKTEEATRLREEAEHLDAMPPGDAETTERTPYGAHCGSEAAAQQADAADEPPSA